MLSYLMPLHWREWKNLLFRWLVILVILITVLLTALSYVVDMPGISYQGPFLPLTAEETNISVFLRRHVEKLAGEIGERHIERPTALHQAAAYIETTFQQLGYSIEQQSFPVAELEVQNLWVKLLGSQFPQQAVVIGAHYDSAGNSPGANDNATGVAAVLELARLLVNYQPKRSIYLVAFVNEELLFIRDAQEIGSHHFATALRTQGLSVYGMLSLETIGYYSEAPNSQDYPIPLLKFIYPDTGNFIAFVGNLASRRLVHQCIENFRQQTPFPSEGIAAPQWLEGINLSDHLSFWRQGWPALMVTDTAPRRYPYYHDPQDVPEQVDYAKTARVVLGLRQVVAALANDTEN